MQRAPALTPIDTSKAHKTVSEDTVEGNSWRAAALASCAFGISMVLNAFAAALLAGIGLTLLAVSMSRRADSSRTITDLRLIAGVIAVALVGVVVPQPLNGLPRGWTAAALPAASIALAVGCLAFRRVDRRRLMTVSVVVLVSVALVAGVRILVSARNSGPDIVLLHKSAAAALAQGSNPYSEAVTVPNGAPGVPAGSMIVGYPYPPIAATSYALSTWITGDPRWINLACWIVLLLSVAYLAWQMADPSPVPVLLVAATPGWSSILQSGWTEPLSAALLGIAAATWNRPVVSGLALGAAFGSKQYFLAALPALLLYRGDGWVVRVAVAAGVGLITLSAPFMWGAADAWRALVFFHHQTPLRADSGNVAGALMMFGLQWAPPAWLALVTAFGIVALVGRRVTTSHGVWRATALGLATLFLLSRQAMPNYWWLVAATALLGSTPDTAASNER
jgi:hypothetical protein